jgi:hypothetical protein
MAEQNPAICNNIKDINAKWGWMTSTFLKVSWCHGNKEQNGSNQRLGRDSEGDSGEMIPDFRQIGRIRSKDLLCRMVATTNQFKKLIFSNWLKLLRVDFKC